MTADPADTEGYTPYYIYPRNLPRIGSGFRRVYVDETDRTVWLRKPTGKRIRVSKRKWQYIPKVEDTGQPWQEALTELQAQEPQIETRPVRRRRRR